jgi:hypothetical protein
MQMPSDGSLEEPRDKPGAIGRVVFGGNVGISIRALKEGRVPPFFCPPGARGEDTFFGMLLTDDVRVDAIPAPLFHDPFFLYPELLELEPPPSLACRVEVTRQTLQRFASAFRGWVGYAPLWIRCQQQNAGRRTETLAKIESIYRRHARCLASLELGDVVDVFLAAARAVETDYALLNEAERCWRMQIVPYICGDRVRTTGNSTPRLR